MILNLRHCIIAKGTGVVAQAVFVAFKIEDITITEEAPVAKASDVKTEVAAVLVVDTRSLGEGITELIVEPRRIVAV